MTSACALVTGAAGGIGRATALALVADGTGAWLPVDGGIGLSNLTLGRE
jgi:NAD(P)-dependent dehydrogenase (short-subunit alcohol dehydrogenase family)